MNEKVRKELLERFNFELFPKEGFDVMEIKVRFNDKFVGWIEVDGLELESWKYEANEQGFRKLEDMSKEELEKERDILRGIKDRNKK